MPQSITIHKGGRSRRMQARYSVLDTEMKKLQNETQTCGFMSGRFVENPRRGCALDRSGLVDGFRVGFRVWGFFL